MIANRIGTHQILYIITAHNIENSHKRDQLMRERQRTRIREQAMRCSRVTQIPDVGIGTDQCQSVTRHTNTVHGTEEGAPPHSSRECRKPTHTGQGTLR